MCRSVEHVNNSHSNTQARCKEETCRDQDILFGQSNDKNENEDPRHFAMSRVVMGEHLLGSKSKKKKRQKLSKDDENRSLKWTHEIATCNADYVGEWDGEWEPCALLGKIGQMCHVVCRVDGKDVFVPEHLVRRAQNKKQQDDMTSASEWYVCVGVLRQKH